MPRFYFHLFNSIGTTVDNEGRELKDLPAAHDVAIATLRDVLGAELKSDGQVNMASFVEIEDADRKLRMTVAAREAVDVTGG